MRGPSPAKASFGSSGAATAQFLSHLGHEQSAFLSYKPSGTQTYVDQPVL